MSDEKIRVAVLGAAGRMGATVCQAVLAAPDMELVAVIDPPHEGRPLDDFGVAGTGLTIQMLGPAVKAAEPAGGRALTPPPAGPGHPPWGAPHRRHPLVRAARAPHPFRPAPGSGGPPGGPARPHRAVALDPPRLLRPHLVHARRPAGGAGGGPAAGADRRPRHPAGVRGHLSSGAHRGRYASVTPAAGRSLESPSLPPSSNRCAVLAGNAAPAITAEGGLPP